MKKTFPMILLLQFCGLAIPLFGQTTAGVSTPCVSYDEDRVTKSYDTNYRDTETGFVRDTLVLSFVMADPLAMEVWQRWGEKNGFAVSEFDDKKESADTRVILKHRLEKEGVSHYAYAISKVVEMKEALKVTDCGFFFLK